MTNVVRLALLSAVCAVALAAPGVAQAQLVATVTDSATISLTKDGVPVTYLTPGTYTIEVHDLTESHNFHLSGPGVSETTGISMVESPTWMVTFGHGVYHFQCDVHPGSMFGDFAVGNVLSVAKAGSGDGTVTSDPAGIACGSTCTIGFPAGGTVTLTAVASTGSTFTGWSGACSGTADCQVPVSGAVSVTATFAGPGGPPPPPPGTGPPASVASVKAAKKKGVRSITVMLDVTRAMTVQVKVTRKGRAIVSSPRRAFAAGHRSVKVTVPKKTKAGNVKVAIVLKGTTGSTTTYTVNRTVRVPK
jgi:hypothetical protein